MIREIYKEIIKRKEEYCKNSWSYIWTSFWKNFFHLERILDNSSIEFPQKFARIFDETLKAFLAFESI